MSNQMPTLDIGPDKENQDTKKEQSEVKLVVGDNGKIITKENKTESDNKKITSKDEDADKNEQKNNVDEKLDDDKNEGKRKTIEDGKVNDNNEDALKEDEIKDDKEKNLKEDQKESDNGKNIANNDKADVISLLPYNEGEQDKSMINPNVPVWVETADGQIEVEDADDYLIYLDDILKRIHK